jgi:hypothetical protein
MSVPWPVAFGETFGEAFGGTSGGSFSALTELWRILKNADEAS